MADLDLTAAVEAAARVHWGQMDYPESYDELDPLHRLALREFVTPVVAAAANVIAEAVYDEAWVDGAVAQHDIPEQRLLAAADIDNKRHNPYREGATK